MNPDGGRRRGRIFRAAMGSILALIVTGGAWALASDEPESAPEAVSEAGETGTPPPPEAVHYVLTDAPVPDLAADPADAAAEDSAAETAARPRSYVFTFSLRESGNVLIRLSDAHGKVIQTLVDEWKPAGDFETQWNGCDPCGQPVEGGAYVIQARLPGKQPVRQVVLVK